MEAQDRENRRTVKPRLQS